MSPSCGSPYPLTGIQEKWTTSKHISEKCQQHNRYFAKVTVCCSSVLQVLDPPQPAKALEDVNYF